MTSGQPARRLSEEGFILIAVLWLLAALATLASVYSVYTIESAATARVPDDRVRAESAIRAGVELTAYRALILPKSQRPTHGAFETRIGDAKIDVRFRSEAARVDLNAAPKELLTGLFISLGASKSALPTATPIGSSAGVRKPSRMRTIPKRRLTGKQASPTGHEPRRSMTSWSSGW